MLLGAGGTEGVQVFVGVDVRAAVDGRVLRRLLVPPEAADVLVRLEADRLDPFREAGLHRLHPGDGDADHCAALARAEGSDSPWLDSAVGHRAITTGREKAALLRLCLGNERLEVVRRTVGGGGEAAVGLPPDGEARRAAEHAGQRGMLAGHPTPTTTARAASNVLAH